MSGTNRRDLTDRVAALEGDDVDDRPDPLDNLDWVPGRPPKLTTSEKRVLDAENDVTPPTQIEGYRP